MVLIKQCCCFGMVQCCCLQALAGEVVRLAWQNIEKARAEEAEMEEAGVAFEKKDVPAEPAVLVDELSALSMANCGPLKVSCNSSSSAPLA